MRFSDNILEWIGTVSIPEREEEEAECPLYMRRMEMCPSKVIVAPQIERLTTLC